MLISYRKSQFDGRLVTKSNSIQLWKKLRNFAIAAANMLGLKEFFFITMAMEYQSLLLMVKYGFLIRSILCDIDIVHCPEYHNQAYLFDTCRSCYHLQSYTQYIPLPISDLDSWLKTPSIYVFDCSAAGMILSAFIEVRNTI